MREERLFSETKHGHTFNATAYTEDGGKTWQWCSNNAYCPLDACKSMGIPCDTELQTAARDRQVDTQLAEYRKRMENHVPSAEELAEERAAFGPGVELVNVITGKRHTT